MLLIKMILVKWQLQYVYDSNLTPNLFSNVLPKHQFFINRDEVNALLEEFEKDIINN